MDWIACNSLYKSSPFMSGERYRLRWVFSNSSLLWDVFIINSVEQLQTLPKTQSEIDISPFLKTQKPSILYSNKVDHYGSVVWLWILLLCCFKVHLIILANKYLSLFIIPPLVERGLFAITLSVRSHFR
jgi:hypothetical protein